MASIDHIFILVPDEATAERMLAHDGLRANYRRAHPGQGTRNACACLDDVFLELLWADGSEPSAATEAIGLGPRLRGEGSALGLAWRGDCALPTLPYAAPFLPDGVTIPVARASAEDASLPFVFRTPGGAPPAERPELSGERQRPELATLGACTLADPEPARLAPFAGAIDGLALAEGPSAFHLTLNDVEGRPARSMTWAAPRG